jgi:hypothetical protein
MASDNSRDSRAENVAGSPLPLTPKFPVACPHCSAPSGYPFQVETSRESHNTLTMSMRCRDCEHSWIQQTLGHNRAPA